MGISERSVAAALKAARMAELCCSHSPCSTLDFASLCEALLFMSSLDCPAILGFSANVHEVTFPGGTPRCPHTARIRSIQLLYNRVVWKRGWLHAPPLPPSSSK